MHSVTPEHDPPATTGVIMTAKMAIRRAQACCRLTGCMVRKVHVSKFSLFTHPGRL